MAGLDAKQGASGGKPADEQLVHPNRDDEREKKDYQIFDAYRRRPSDRVEGNGHDHWLVKHIEWQYGILPIVEQFGAPIQDAHTKR